MRIPILHEHTSADYKSSSSEFCSTVLRNWLLELSYLNRIVLVASTGLRPPSHSNEQLSIVNLLPDMRRASDGGYLNVNRTQFGIIS